VVSSQGVKEQQVLMVVREAAKELALTVVSEAVKEPALTVVKYPENQLKITTAQWLVVVTHTHLVVNLLVYTEVNEVVKEANMRLMEVKEVNMRLVEVKEVNMCLMARLVPTEVKEVVNLLVPTEVKKVVNLLVPTEVKEVVNLLVPTEVKLKEQAKEVKRAPPERNTLRKAVYRNLEIMALCLARLPDLEHAIQKQ